MRDKANFIESQWNPLSLLHQVPKALILHVKGEERKVLELEIIYEIKTGADQKQGDVILKCDEIFIINKYL